MRPARVRLVDLGVHEDFTTAMSFAQSTIQSLVARRAPERPYAEVEFIRTRDWDTVVQALQSEAAVVHIVGHGSNAADSLGFWSDDEHSTWSLVDIAKHLQETQYPIDTGVLFADCCDTGKQRFAAVVRDCIAHDTLYIGATKSVNWHESTAFAAAFYASYFKDKGRGLDPVARGVAAADRAINGYAATVGGRCPFTAGVLRPSRRARKAFA